MTPARGTRASLMRRGDRVLLDDRGRPARRRTDARTVTVADVRMVAGGRRRIGHDGPTGHLERDDGSDVLAGPPVSRHRWARQTAPALALAPAACGTGTPAVTPDSAPGARCGHAAAHR